MHNTENLDLFKNDFSNGFLTENLFRDKNPFDLSDEEFPLGHMENPFDCSKLESSSFPVFKIDENFFLENNLINKPFKKESNEFADYTEPIKINNNKSNNIKFYRDFSPLIKENFISQNSSLLACRTQFTNNNNNNQEMSISDSLDKNLIKSDYHNSIKCNQAISLPEGFLKNYLMKHTLLIEDEAQYEKMKEEKIKDYLKTMNEVVKNDNNNNSNLKFKTKLELKRKKAKLLCNKQKRGFSCDTDIIEAELKKDAIIDDDLCLNSDKNLNQKINKDEKFLAENLKDNNLNNSHLMNKKELRRMKNREAAVKSRLNKKLKLETLSEINDKLAGENSDLKNSISEITKSLNKLCSKCKEKLNLEQTFNKKFNNKQVSKINNDPSGCENNRKNKKIKIEDIENNYDDRPSFNSANRNKKLSLATGFVLIVCLIGTLINSYSNRTSIDTHNRDLISEGNKMRILNFVHEKPKDAFYSIDHYNPVNLNNENNEEVNLFNQKNSVSGDEPVNPNSNLNSDFSQEIFSRSSATSQNIEKNNVLENINSTTNTTNDSIDDKEIKNESTNKSNGFLAGDTGRSINKISLKPNIIYELIEKNSKNYQNKIEKEKLINQAEDKIKKDNFYNLVFTSSKCNDSNKEYQEEKEPSRFGLEEKSEREKINSNHKINLILHPIENSNQSYGNLKSSQVQKLNLHSYKDEQISNRTDVKNSFGQLKKQNTVSLANYTSNESCINNPSFLKFMEKSKLNHAANEKLYSGSIYNEIENLDEISDYYTKNLNLSSEEKLNIKNCIVMQIINSSTTTLNLGDIGTINKKQYDSKQIFTIQDDVYLKIVISAENIYDNIKSNLKDFRLSNFTLLDSIIKKDIFTNYKGNESRKLYFVIKCQIKDLKLLNYST